MCGFEVQKVGIEVIELRVDNGGSSGGGSFKVEHGSDGWRSQMCMKPEHERLETWLEKEI